MPSEPIEFTVMFQPSSRLVSSLTSDDKVAHERLASQPITINKMVYYNRERNTTHLLVNSVQWSDVMLVRPVDLGELDKQNVQQRRFLTRSSTLRSPTYSSLEDGSIPHTVLTSIDKKFAFIPAKRRIADEEPRVVGPLVLPFDGNNLKNALQKLKNSGDARERRKFEVFKEKIDKLNFAAGSMESIEVGQYVDLSFDHSKELSFPLSSQGTGIHEILIFIVNLMLCDNYFFGIEEPENHLHFDAQKTLLDIFEEESIRNQIFLTSHSSLFVDRLNYELGSVYLTKLNKDGQTEIQNIYEPEQFELIVAEIGNISSLLASDAIIFVEGKSDESIFRSFADTIKAFSRARLEFIDMTGRDKLPYFASIKLVMRTNRDLPFFYIVDGTEGKKREEVIDEFCESAKSNVGLGNDQIERLRHSVFVLSKGQIEAYLLRPSTVAHVFEIPEDKVESWFKMNESKKNKFYVLDELLRQHGKGKYDKKLDGTKIAKALRKEEIDEELVRVIEQIIQLTRMLETGDYMVTWEMGFP